MSLPFLMSCVFASAMPGPATAPAGQTAQQQYESLFGEAERKAAASATKRDDADLAVRLIEAARKSGDSPALRQLLCQKAYEFGLRWKDGHAAAQEACEMLAESLPSSDAEWRRKFLEVCELRYRGAAGEDRVHYGRLLVMKLLTAAEAAEESNNAPEAVALYRRALTSARETKHPYAAEIQQQLERAAVHQKTEADIAAAEKAHQAAPSNQAAASKLLMLYLTERDDPNKAAELLAAAGGDEKLRTYLPLASKPWMELDDRIFLELGAWYESLAAKAGAFGRPRMLARARAYYRSFLSLHGKADAAALPASAALARVEKAIAGLPPGECAFVAAPQGVTREVLEWTARRDALPADEQIVAVKEMLGKVNGGATLKATGEVREERLVGLFLGGNEALTSIAPLYGMRLERLDVTSTGVTSLQPLRGMQLIHFQGSGCRRLATLEGLEESPLSGVDVSYSSVRSLRPLRAAKLKSLSVSNCVSLPSLRGIENMPLTYLTVKECASLRDLEPLRGMNLRSLDLMSYGNAADLGALQGMPLEELNLTGMSLTSLAALRGLKLRKLNLNNCRSLASLEGLQDMPLEELNLMGTKFATLQVAEQLKRKIPTLKEVILK